MPRAWIGDWEKRIAERFSARGHQTITEFIEAFPGMSLVHVAKTLGDDVAADQLLRMYRLEASRDPGTFAMFARSTLTRRIIDLVPGGWGLDTSGESHAYGAWSTDVGEAYDDAIERVYEVLDANAPRGWIPSGPDDPLILKAFERWEG